MIEVTNVEIWGFEHAIRGMRNPLNSWGKSDSIFGVTETVGENDILLMKRLYKAGPEHRKFMRQIFVSMDIKAPLYWWKEFDTYKVGTVANSCSTMHTIHKKEFTEDDFSFEKVLDPADRAFINKLLCVLNEHRELYLETRHKDHWYAMIQLLPASFNQKRTVTMNYENVVNIMKQRKNHKLHEWHEFIERLEKLPYINEIMN